jgi:CRISPR-associated exonuclease Cas4
MHEVFNRKYTPKAVKGKHCDSCSIKDLCLPNLGKQERTFVKEYMEAHLK